MLTNIPGAAIGPASLRSAISLLALMPYAISPRPGEVIAYRGGPITAERLFAEPAPRSVPDAVLCVHREVADRCEECDVDMEGKE